MDGHETKDDGDTKYSQKKGEEEEKSRRRRGGGGAEEGQGRGSFGNCGSASTNWISFRPDQLLSYTMSKRICP